MRIRATGSPEALGEVLRELEAHRPLLFIERLSLAPSRARPRGRHTGGSASRMLSVDLEVSGYFLESGLEAGAEAGT